MRRLNALLPNLIAFVALTACSGADKPQPECGIASDCPAGNACRDEKCYQVCETTLDCAEERCLDGICRAPTADDLPVITSISGNGETSTVIADGLVIEGLRLADATFELTSGTETILLVPRTVGAERAEVMLPATIVSGEYELVVVNAAGTAQAPVTLTLPELSGDTLIDRINSEGTKSISSARLPIGTTSSTVAAGDHHHDTDYYPRSEADLLFYSQTEADALFYSRAQVDAGFYTKADIDAGFYTKADIDAGYYTKTEIDAGHYTKAEADSTFYSQSEVDAGFYPRTEADSTFLAEADFPFDGIVHVDAANGRIGINEPAPTTSLHVQGAMALNGFITETFHHVGQSSTGVNYEVVLLDASAATFSGIRGAVTFVCGNRGSNVMAGGTAYFHVARSGDGSTLNGGISGDLFATLGPRWNGGNLELTVPRFHDCSGWITYR